MEINYSDWLKDLKEFDAVMTALEWIAIPITEIKG